MTRGVTRDYIKDFQTFDTNSDGFLSENEMLKYRNERFDAFGEGSVDIPERNHIRDLIKGLRKDKKLDQNDFFLVADTLLQAEYRSIGRQKLDRLPDMKSTMSWTGTLDLDMPSNRFSSLDDAKDYLKFCLKGKTGISDAEKLHLFNCLEDRTFVEGTLIDNNVVRTLVNYYIPVFAKQDVFK